MDPLSSEGQKTVADLAQRYGVSSQAVMTLLHAVMAGNGSMAQFNHPELGGLGQWSQGGMTMVGDMFNNALKSKVDGLCSELSRLVSREPFRMQQSGASTQTQSQGDVSLFVSSSEGSFGHWWGADLGMASSTGSQNHIRYAYFPGTRRLAVGIGDRVVIYDTGDHQIGGVSQQQGGDASLTFTSQRGLVRVADLPVVSQTGGAAPETPAHPTPPAVSTNDAPPIRQASPVADAANATHPEDIFGKLERLAELHKKGILSQEEFAAKKTELLGRI
jgi:hypothetical protein